MPNYTTNLNLEKPLQSEQYNIDVFNANADKIDQFAGQVPARALTADKLTTGAKINGVNFKGDTDVVTGAGFYYKDVTYSKGDLAFIYNNDKLELHKSLQNGNINHNPLSTTGYWEKQDLGGGNGYEIGDLIWRSLPTQDAGKHLLDGTRLSGDGIYKGFIDYIAELYKNNPTANYFTDETTWQASITQYGVCGKFVYDSTLNTVRLPKITGIIEGTIDVTALGDLVEAGLPQHKHTRGTMDIQGSINTGARGVISSTSGVFSGSGSKVNDWGGSGSQSLYKALNFKASNNWTGATSNADYTSTIATTTTVQPQTIKGFVYIIIATSTKTDIEVDIDEIATDLNGKADTDLSNISSTGQALFDGKADVDLTNTTDQAKILMGGMGMPSSTNEDLTLPANGGTVQAPADGWITLVKAAKAAGQYIRLEANGISFKSIAQGVNDNCVISIPIKAGAECTVQYTTAGSTYNFRFVYAEGSTSLSS